MTRLEEDRRRIRVFDVSPSPIEFLTAVMCLVWGAWLLLPFDTFHSSHVWMKMEAAMSEWAWGAFFLSTGLAHILVFFRVGISGRTIWEFWNFAIWTYVGITFVQSLPGSLAGPTYLVFALANAWAYLRLRRAI